MSHRRSLVLADQARRPKTVEQGLHPSIQTKGRGVKLAARHRTVVAGDRFGSLPRWAGNCGGVGHR